ncbi:MAG: hydroxymethylglutaryl-CoA lyase, partial [Caulobacterales bacterium]|nr:hydroxymethylglutaryl-CoA lyase [Caulobacterales bacterium]
MSSGTGQRIDIVEVGARDGLQNEKTVLEVGQKLELIHRLEACGVRRQEVVSFVNPTRVPQMAGAEETMAALPHDDARSRIGLVLNMRGWDRCVAAACDEANVVVCASDGFGIRNQGASVDEQITTMANIMGVRRKEDP